MKKDFTKVYQFKITLKGIKPPIWRRIQVPDNFTFFYLHKVIQDAMGWDNVHLHSFGVVNPKTGLKDEIGTPENKYDPVMPEKKAMISNYFTKEKQKGLYIYDFGDNWEHVILLEKILPRDDISIKYPRCIDGKRARPLEDCGGAWGYEELLATIADPNHAEHAEMLEWVGEGFDPEEFEASDEI